MLDFGWTELLVIAVVAIVVIGPKDLPRAMRAVGQWTGKMKRMAREFQGQFNEALREAELDSVKRDVEAIGKIDPVGDMRKEMTKAEAGIKKDLQVTAPEDGKSADAKSAKPAGKAESPKAKPKKAAPKATDTDATEPPKSVETPAPAVAEAAEAAPVADPAPAGGAKP